LQKYKSVLENVLDNFCDFTFARLLEKINEEAWLIFCTSVSYSNDASSDK